MLSYTYMKTINICMICDNDYVMPTLVALTSIIRNKNESTSYNIYIIASDLSDNNIALFNSKNSKNININIINVKQDTFEGYHKFEEGKMCVASISALFKFMIPSLLSDLDKVLYLDGDIIVKDSLDELYNTNIDNYYAAAVIDSGRIYYLTEFNKKYPEYFNSGVMLLNLDKLRKENVEQLLIDTKKNLNDSSLMDQNVFNIVFENKVKLLPIRYNLLPVNLMRTKKMWKIEEINNLYKTNYKNRNELFYDARIIHYSSKDKPWKDLDGTLSNLWIDYYLDTDSISHDLIKPLEITTPFISIISSNKNISLSLNKQSNKNFEILSNDLSDINKINGKYILNIDQNIKLDNNAIETIINTITHNNLDMLIIEGHDDKDRLNNVYPKVYSYQELLEQLNKFHEHLPFNRLIIKKELLNNLDNAKRIKVINEKLFTRKTNIISRLFK